MAKFYVQCGWIKRIVQTDDAQGAAIWAIHQALDKQLDVESIDWSDEGLIDDLQLAKVLMSLDDDIRVSEIGLGRCEAGWFDTPDIMHHWQQLMIALSNMCDRMDGVDKME